MLEIKSRHLSWGGPISQDSWGLGDYVRNYFLKKTKWLKLANAHLIINYKLPKGYSCMYIPKLYMKRLLKLT